MEKAIVEKFSRNGRDFIIIIWDNGQGVLHEETFEVRKVSEREVSDTSASKTLTQAKQSIEIGIETRSI